MASSSMRRLPTEKADPPPSASSRRTLPIKRADAEPLSREDIQYDFLDAIFRDQHAVFTNKVPQASKSRAPKKVTFFLREKMVETPEFAIDFAKLCLLTNVGRINTTMAFFPEMRTVLRSYHPIPSLQKTDVNLQDAPRIKNCLKACLLPRESPYPPMTPEDIIAHRRSGIIPTTSIVNLIFVLSSHSIRVSRMHFEPPFDFLDLFLPANTSPKSRAQAFLWLMFNYLESPSTRNPFSDDYANQHPGKAPKLTTLSLRQRQLQDLDTAEELAYGRRMAQYRSKFLQKQIAEEEREKAFLKSQSDSRASKARVTSPITPRQPTSPQQQKANGDALDKNIQPLRENTPLLHNTNTSNASNANWSHIVPTPTSSTFRGTPHWRGSPFFKPRTMLEHALHMATTTDPLTCSDEEIANEHVKEDYGKIGTVYDERRVHVLNTHVLRRKAMTPEPERSGNSRAILTTEERRSLLHRTDWSHHRDL